MRILKYFNEHKTECPHCKTLLAYNQDDFIEEIDEREFVDDVKTYLSKLDKVELQQLTTTQKKILKEHPDYVCMGQYRHIFLKCLRCGEVFKLYDKLVYLEIYPADSHVEYGTGGMDLLKQWDKFNEVKL